MVAFSNSRGGDIFIGVFDDNQLLGLSPENLGRINRQISNTGSQNARSTITVTTENTENR